MPDRCLHPRVYPDGTCVSCARLATGFPGLSEAHEMIPWPGKLPERDPRSNPQPGDVLRIDGRERHVYDVRPRFGTGTIMVHFRWDGCEYVVLLSSWRKWAKNAEVLSRG